MYGLYWIQVYSGFGLDRFHYTLKTCPCSHPNLKVTFFLSCHKKLHMNWTSLKKSPFRCLKNVLIQIWLYIENHLRRVWKYQRGNQNPYIEEEQTTQWPKEKVQKDKQQSIKHIFKTKDRVTRTPLKTGGELRYSGRVCSSCSTSGTRRVNLVTNPVISRKWGKDQEVFTTSGKYPWSFVTQIFHNSQPWINQNPA
jgi:hypothetical protein